MHMYSNFMASYRGDHKTYVAGLPYNIVLPVYILTRWWNRNVSIL